MARLNEPPIIGESIESLKRRFMRQNRELAKSNAELKIKVATIESDRAKLLSENITINGELIHLQEERALDYTKQSVENIVIVKDKLMSKFAELTELMSELNTASTKPPKQEQKIERRKSYHRSPTQTKNWKSTLCGPEMTGLASIVEDKYWPRRTLGADEIQSISPDSESSLVSSDSRHPPNTGSEPSPPPNPSSDSHERVVEERAASGSMEPADMFANLETRRKRRTSALMREDKLIPEPAKEMEPMKSIQPQPLLKAGAKRKFSTHEEEDKVRRPSIPEHTSFSFSRKSGVAPHAGDRSLKGAPGRKPNKTGDQSDGTIRKALGEKTVNTDPVVSPVKRTAEEKAARDDLIKAVKERRKNLQAKAAAKAEKLRQASPKFEIPPAAIELEELDVFSPSESVTSGNLGRDTPPPSELTSRSAENTRPSRRQRPQVSYAEPSLRDKMRRPGKELADAVVTKTAKDELVLKDELPSWKPENFKEDAGPNSPLQSKSLTVEEPPPSMVATDRKRKSIARTNETGIADLTSEMSKTAIAAMVSSQRRLSRVKGLEIDEASNPGSSEIFNIDGSSPETERAEAAISGQSSRRHSSISDMRNRKENQVVKVDVEDFSRSGRIASRRRSMQI